MEANEGARWVIQNSNVITAYANRFLKSAPYEMRDYMQEAFIASLKAYKQFPNTTEDTFRRAFWRLFKDAITETVPRPDKTSSPRRVRSNESMSIPSSVCISDDEGGFEQVYFYLVTPCLNRARVNCYEPSSWIGK